VTTAAIAVARPKGRLLQVLGVAFGISVIIGNTISAGILRTPGEVAARLPSPAAFLAVWLAGGIYALLGVVSLTELGVMMPKSGGQYVFAREAFGPFPGFVIGWSDWVSTCASVAAVCILVGEYLGDVIAPLRAYHTTVAVCIVAVFTLLQWRGVRWGDGAQQVTSLLKTLAFAALIVACFALGGNATSAPANNSLAIPAGAGLLTAIVIALQSVIYTYDGWNGMLYFSEEVREPARDIPRAMFGGVIAVIVIYLLVNVAFLRVLGIGGLAGNTFAAGAVARAIWGARGDLIIRGLMIVSLISGANAMLLMGSRVPYAMARDGLFSRVALRVNAGGTPTVTLASSALLATLLIVTGTFAIAIAIAAFFFVLNYVASFAAVFALRRRLPNATRGYRAWGYPVTTAISLAGGVAFLVGTVFEDQRNSAYALGLLLISYPVYRWTVAKKTREA
jgi:APA family basic amino acid/polyamine antiporter